MEETWLEPYIPKKGETFIDVGAHKGTWTHYLAPGYTKVHAIEPNPDCWGDLTGENIVLHRVAAWSTVRKIVFGQRDGCYVPDVAPSVFGPAQDSAGITVCMPIDHMNISEVSLIKIDTEGAEYQVVMGADKTIKRDRPKLIIEIHHQDNDNHIRTWLDNYEFEVVRHPFYAVTDTRWAHHYWIIGTPK